MSPSNTDTQVIAALDVLNDGFVEFVAANANALGVYNAGKGNHGDVGRER